MKLKYIIVDVPNMHGVGDILGETSTLFGALVKRAFRKTKHEYYGNSWRYAKHGSGPISKQGWCYFLPAIFREEDVVVHPYYNDMVYPLRGKNPVVWAKGPVLVPFMWEPFA